MTGPSTLRAIASTASKSPGEVIGNPASITSTPSRASCAAISTFSLPVKRDPGRLLAVAKRGIEDLDPVRLRYSRGFVPAHVGDSFSAASRLNDGGARLRFQLRLTPDDLCSRLTRCRRFTPRQGGGKGTRLWSRWLIGRRSVASPTQPSAESLLNRSRARSSFACE